MGCELPFCMMAYNMTPHRSTGESLFHTSWSVDESLGDYKSQLLQSIAETRKRDKKYNDRVREKIKREHDRKNKVETKKYPKVGDKVYLLSLYEKALNTHHNHSPSIQLL